MAVPEQTPYKEYTANGSTTSFALGFICDSKNDLIVLVDGVAPPVATWSLIGANAVFTTAPASGKKIVLQRNTAMSRTANYQSNNNSFRPETINKDIDRVWWKIQELGVRDWLLDLKIQKFRDDVNLTAMEETLEQAQSLRDNTAAFAVDVQNNVTQSQTLLANTTAQANAAAISATNANLSKDLAKQYADNIDASLTAIAGGHKAYQTLALAQADQASLPANTIVEVTNDPTPTNNGTYQWNGTTLTKSAYDPLTQARVYTDESLSELSEDIEELIILDQTDGFIEQTKGPFVGDFNTPASASLTIVNGEAVVTSNISTGSIVSIDTLRHILDNVQRRLILKFKVEDASSTTGAAIFVGENTGILYSSNGVISVVNTAWDVQGGQGVTDPLLAFTANEEVSLDVTLNGDGSGVATATNASGYNRALAFTGMQKGAVHLAIRRSFDTKSTTFKSLSVVSNPVTAKNISDAGKGVTPKGFDNSLTGFYNITTDSVYFNYNLSIFGSVLSIDTNGANSAVYYAKNGTAFNEAAEFELEFKKKTGTITAGGCIIIGDGANRKIFAYLSNGAIGLLTAAGGIESGSVIADMAFNNEQNVKIRISVSDGDAVLTAMHPTGKTHSLSYTGVPYGNVYVGWRGGSSTADLNYLSKQGIPSSYLTLEKKLNVSSPSSKIPKTWKVLPDSESGRVVKGFTCTGLAKITAGQFRGCWAVGDDGRLSEDVSSPYNPQVHILDGDFNQILLTIPSGYTANSMQGVAFDTVTNSHIWAACAGNNTLRKYSLAIGSEGTEIVEDRITMASLGLSVTPNALAFDGTRGTGKGALWLSSSSGGNIYLIDCDPLATNRVIDTITVANTVDHIQLLDDQILYQGAANGRKTTVFRYDIATNSEVAQWVDLECWTAPEGLYYDKTFRTLYAINDGGFHNSENSSPRFNCVLEYSLDF